MDWANERYVRFYVRDSTTWKLVDWKARCTLAMLLRKVDRAGVLEVGNHGVLGLAAVIELPLEVVEPGIAQLVDPRIKVVVVTPTHYVVPNFIEAQEAVQTEAHRSREYRGRKRDLALASVHGFVSVTNRDGSTTCRDETVTPRHEASQAVTPILSGLVQIQEEIAPPARARDPVLVTPTPESKERFRFAESWWNRFCELRAKLVAEFGLKRVRPLHLHDPGRAELQARIREAGPERAAADLEHVFAALERESREKGNVDRLNGAAFQEKAWRWALSQSLDKPPARAGPRAAIGAAAPRSDHPTSSEPEPFGKGL